MRTEGREWVPRVPSIPPNTACDLQAARSFRALSYCSLTKVPHKDVKVIPETFDHHVEPMGKAQGGA